MDKDLNAHIADNQVILNETRNGSIVDDLVILTEGDKADMNDASIYRDVVLKMDIYPFIDNPLIFLGFKW